MAKEDKKVITLVAVERGFYSGRLVEPGKQFPFVAVGEDGKERKKPKWATTPDDPQLSKAKPQAKVGDLRPADAQAAAKAKASGLANDLAG